jgi:hypothetical protein
VAEGEFVDGATVAMSYAGCGHGAAAGAVNIGGRGSSPGLDGLLLATGSPTFRHFAPLRTGPRTSSRRRWWWRRAGRGPTSLRFSGGGSSSFVVLHACCGWGLGQRRLPAISRVVDWRRAEHDADWLTPQPCLRRLSKHDRSVVQCPASGLAHRVRSLLVATARVRPDGENPAVRRVE